MLKITKKVCRKISHHLYCNCKRKQPLALYLQILRTNNNRNSLLKDAERLLKLLLKEANEISNDANKNFDEQVKLLYSVALMESLVVH